MAGARGWAREAGRRTRKYVPVLLQLEDRIVPALVARNFINHGGPVLDHAEVAVVLYCQGWSGDAGQTAAGQVKEFMQYLVSSPFMNTLAQYGVGAAQVTGSVVVPDALGVSVTPGQIEEMLAHRIADGTLPSPGDDRLYAV